MRMAQARALSSGVSSCQYDANQNIDLMLIDGRRIGLPSLCITVVILAGEPKVDEEQRGRSLLLYYCPSLRVAVQYMYFS